MAETIDQDIFDEAGSDGDDNTDPDEELDSKLSPWRKSFDELKMLMVQVPYEMGTIYVLILFIWFGKYLIYSW